MRERKTLTDRYTYGLADKQKNGQRKKKKGMGEKQMNGIAGE